jgi:hypothetical protein
VIDWFSELYRIIKLISYGGTSKKLTAQLISALDNTLTTGGGGDASLLLNSSGPPFTIENAGIVITDDDGLEVLRLLSDGSGDPSQNGGSNGNLFLGSGAGANTTALNNDNTGIGSDALQQNTEGGFNTAVGAWALIQNIDGFNNTAIGYSANEANESGGDNTAIGYESGADGTDLNQTTVIGSKSKAGGNNSIVIGYNKTTNADNVVQIGNDDNLPIYFADGSCGIGADDNFFGPAGGLVFPDSDPHIAGAGYWLAGVLTRSSG